MICNFHTIQTDGYEKCAVCALEDRITELEKEVADLIHKVNDINYWVPRPLA
jgi:hypothetical protein